MPVKLSVYLDLVINIVSRYELDLDTAVRYSEDFDKFFFSVGHGNKKIKRGIQFGVRVLSLLI